VQVLILSTYYTTFLKIMLYSTYLWEYATMSYKLFLSLLIYMYVIARFFGSPEQAAVLVGVPGRRLELKGCLVAGPHSFSHVGLSKELATANPELTLPMFCGNSREREREREKK
jgi:hypothetical protein